MHSRFVLYFAFAFLYSLVDPLLCVQTAAVCCPHDAPLSTVVWHQCSEWRIHLNSAFSCLSFSLLIIVTQIRIMSCHYVMSWFYCQSISSKQGKMAKCLTSSVKENRRFICPLKCMAHGMFHSPYAKQKHCSFIFDLIMMENLTLFCFQDLLLLYEYLLSGRCCSASLRHYRSWGH